MSSGLIGIVKQAALDAVENAQICDLRFGEVVSVTPLKVKVTNQLTIPSSLLIVPEHLTNREVSATINGYDDIQTIVINNELRLGDRIAMLRKQGGQSYFILDRI